MNHRWLGLLFVGAWGCAPSPASEASPIQPASRPAEWPTQMAARFDVVEYHQSGEATAGRRAHQLIHDDGLFYFASAENRDRFAQNPAQYMPQFNGWCACAMALGGRAYPSGTDFEVIDDRLYLFAGPREKKTWMADPQRFIARATANFADLR